MVKWKRGIEHHHATPEVQNPFRIATTVSRGKVQYEPISVNDRLMAIGLLAGGATVLYFLGSSGLGLSFAASCSTLGIMVLLGKFRKKVE